MMTTTALEQVEGSDEIVSSVKRLNLHEEESNDICIRGNPIMSA